MITVSTILCPLDLSDVSRTALSASFALARWYDARVVVTHIVPVAVAPAMLTLEAPAAMSPQQQADAARALEELVREAGPGAVPVTIGARAGFAVGEIVAEASQLPADLIVMGTHGRTGFEHLLMGSVAERVLRKVSCPVLTLRSDVAPPEAAGAAPFKRIVCAVDFSPASERALAHALTLAQESGGRLTVVHVQNWPVDIRASEVLGPDASRYQRELHERAERDLRAVVPAEARTWCEIVERVETGRPHEAVLAVAREVEADLIAIGAHGRRGPQLHVLGSTTDRVVREAACPVLTVRPL